MATDLTVSKTILEQLGGNYFIRMTGSTNFVGSSDKLSFKLARNKSKATHMTITLTPMDVYTVEAFRCNIKTGINVLQTIENVYAEDLQKIFTSVTGLYTRL